jgi:hypothetical protein
VFVGGLCVACVYRLWRALWLTGARYQLF